MKRVLTCILVVVLLTPAALSSYRIEVEPEGRRIPARTFLRDGTLYLHLADIAAALNGSRHWNARTGKAALVVGEHRFVMAPENPFVVVDGRVVNVLRTVVFRGGEFWVPSAFLSEAIGPALHIEARVDRENERVVLEDLGPLIGEVSVGDRAGGTVVTVPLSARADIHVESASTGAIQLFVYRAALSDSVDIVASRGYVTRVTAEQRQGGVSLNIETTPDATAYRVESVRAPHRIEVVVESTAETVPAPALRTPKELLTKPPDPFMMSEDLDVVMIDPGYGGHETGVVGRGGVLAKDVALEVAEALGAALQRQGFYVFMTRSSDSSVPLQRRCELANLADADIFIAIRCDGWVSGAAAGFQVQHYEVPADTPLPVVQPRRGGLRYDHPSVLTKAEETLLWRRVQAEHVDESRILARLVRGELRSALPSVDRGVRGLPHVALEGCAMPAIVVDVAFLTSGGDAGRAQDGGFREDAARAVARGVVAYKEGWKERNR
jgi:N-acetylmuramoyl-L-alanine amidase